jgi:RAB protein geranylgeranyltransferase component A
MRKDFQAFHSLSFIHSYQLLGNLRQEGFARDVAVKGAEYGLMINEAAGKSYEIGNVGNLQVMSLGEAEGKGTERENKHW